MIESKRRDVNYSSIFLVSLREFVVHLFEDNVECKKYFPILFLMYLILSIHTYIYIKYVNSYLNCEYRFEKIYRRKETRE